MNLNVWECKLPKYKVLNHHFTGVNWWFTCKPPVYNLVLVPEERKLCVLEEFQTDYKV